MFSIGKHVYSDALLCMFEGGLDQCDTSCCVINNMLLCVQRFAIHKHIGLVTGHRCSVVGLPMVHVFVSH